MTAEARRLMIVVWSAFALVLAGVAATQVPAIAGEMSQEEFERRVRDYLLANPEVIVKSLQDLEARRLQAEARESKAALTARADEILRDPASPVGGNAEGDVTLVEFFDYNCPYCRQVAPVMEEAGAADPQLRIVYKEFPILGPGSVFAAKAALAAHRQGRYETFHRALMRAKSSIAEPTVLKVAAEVGLDVPRLEADMRDPAIQAAIDRNLKLAEALRINGTPGFVIGDEILRGVTDLATMKELIGQARTSRK